jgi:general stress protein 26
MATDWTGQIQGVSSVAMSRPLPQPVDPATLPQLAQDTMRAAKFPMLATVDSDQPRLRPVSPVRTDGFTVYVANLRSYGKTHELAANPKAELCYKDVHDNQVRITATAEIVTERPLLEEIWAANPLLRAYLGSIDNPELIIYRFVPNLVRYMREWALEYFEVPFETQA